MNEALIGDNVVTAEINYLEEMRERPAFYAENYSRDNLLLKPQAVPIHDLRRCQNRLSLDREGFVLASHQSGVSDFRDANEVTQIYLPEIERLLLEMTGAGRVIMMRHGVLRFGERSKEYGSRVNTRPARFVHVDYTDTSVSTLLNPMLDELSVTMEPGQRFIGLNIWRVLSPPPQDVPLAVCDARTVADEDLVRGDAVFDAPDAPEFSFEAFLVKSNPAHRWFYCPAMNRDEVLIFKAYDSDASRPARVPHCAFDDPNCPRDVPPRASIEVRAFALF